MGTGKDPLALAGPGPREEYLEAELHFLTSCLHSYAAHLKEQLNLAGLEKLKGFIPSRFLEART